MDKRRIGILATLFAGVLLTACAGAPRAVIRPAGQKNNSSPMPAAAGAAVSLPGLNIVVANSSGLAGGTVAVPISLASQGNVNALSFSLNWDATLLKYAGCALGADGVGCTLMKNETHTEQGRVGILIGEKPPTAFPAGARRVLVVTFNCKAGWAGEIPLSFGNTPAAEGVSDVNGRLLSATWQNGQIKAPRMP